MSPFLALLLLFALAATPVAGRGAGRELRRDPSPPMRVVVGSARYEARAGAAGAWVLRDAWGRVHASGSGAPAWGVERRNRRVRITFDATDRVTAWSDEPFTLAPASAGEALMWNGRRYRGTIAFVPDDTAILVVNYVDLESYLRGVVPVELGVRSPKEQAALEAQAVAARSYAIVRQREGAARRFDLTSGAVDQAYGGLDAEHPLADAAVTATAGLVLWYNGSVVRAPYHSTCGGHTVPQSEAWSGERDVPYLRGVRDAPEGSDRDWCEISPRYRWERTLDRHELEAAVSRYVSAQSVGRDAASAGSTFRRAAASGASGGVGGGVRGVQVERITRSGRVETLALATDGGTMRLSGTALRTTLRNARGEIVNSTYFSVEPVIGRDGRLMQLTLRGAGNGHGVGMCQWGAIARARAGHDVQSILSAYFPGTVVARLP